MGVAYTDVQTHYVRSGIDQSTGHLEGITAIHTIRDRRNRSGGTSVHMALGLNGLGIPSTPTMSINEQLENVKVVYNDTLSTKVLEHFGLQSRITKDSKRCRYAT